jgi:hypothetical protein
MNEFWLWFWRPMAEFLGALALFGALAGLAALGLGVAIAWRWLRSVARGKT